VLSQPKYGKRDVILNKRKFTKQKDKPGIKTQLLQPANKEEQQLLQRLKQLLEKKQQQGRDGRNNINMG
jgi:hypothetical protein